ncbi:MAG: L,D-transpeptidase family protein [Myxococcota bacterium]|nr:L,D-transpeptidase family protein [Myxococcota bacterium]
MARTPLTRILLTCLTFTGLLCLLYQNWGSSSVITPEIKRLVKWQAYAERLDLPQGEAEMLSQTESHWAADRPWEFQSGLPMNQWSEAAPGVKLPFSGWRYQGESSAQARRRSAATRSDAMRGYLKAASLPWPPAELLLRAYKAEGELELWGSPRKGAQMVPVLTWKLCALSGTLGPKRREGDGQVPEGIYEIGHLNPRSKYHLSMRVSYPNRSDRILGHPREPGSAIMIHGGCASVGCLAMGDERIEELWTLVETFRRAHRRRKIHLYIFPARAWERLLGYAPLKKYHALWHMLSTADTIFQKEGRPPRFRVNAAGDYLLPRREQLSPPTPSAEVRR